MKRALYNEPLLYTRSPVPVEYSITNISANHSSRQMPLSMLINMI